MKAPSFTPGVFSDVLVARRNHHACIDSTFIFFCDTHALISAFKSTSALQWSQVEGQELRLVDQKFKWLLVDSLDFRKRHTPLFVAIIFWDSLSERYIAIDYWIIFDLLWPFSCIITMRGCWRRSLNIYFSFELLSRVWCHSWRILTLNWTWIPLHSGHGSSAS